MNKVCEMHKEMEKTEEEEKDSASRLEGFEEMMKMADDSKLHQSLELESARRKGESAMEKVKKLKLQLAEKTCNLAKKTEELSVLKHSHSQTQTRFELLDKKYRYSKESEERVKSLLVEQTKELEHTNISLQQSKLEIQSLHEKLEKCCSNTAAHLNQLPTHDMPVKNEFESLRLELESSKRHVGVLKNELKLATEAEENNKKAMDDLAMALKEVATEANQLKGKYSASKEELKQRREAEERYKCLLEEGRRETEMYKSSVERLRLEAEESLLAWSGRETSLVDCIRSSEEERFNAQQENRHLMDALRLAELKNMTSKEEIKKLRDILKQALNEATVSKEAAEIAIEENSELKDCLAEKENALDFVTTENETLKLTHAAALEEIKELKQLLEEANKKEENKSKEEGITKEQVEKEITKFRPPLSPTPTPTPKPTPAEKEDTFGKRLGKALSFSFLELKMTPEKKKEVEEDEEEPEMEETLKGSIFDDVDSPDSARVHQRKRSLSQFGDDGEMNYEIEDFDQLEGENLDELEGDRNSRKKKALIRRFGDLLMRRKSFQKKEQSPE